MKKNRKTQEKETQEYFEGVHKFLRDEEDVRVRIAAINAKQATLQTLTRWGLFAFCVFEVVELLLLGGCL